MEDNLKKTFKSINDFADNFVEIKEALKKEQEKNIKFGMELQKLKSDNYYFPKLVAFLKGENVESYNNYFSMVKPLYDKYGYQIVNEWIIKIADEEEEVKDE